MAKKKKGPRVRAAKAGDRNLFRKLWLEHLTSAYENKDSEIKPTESNVDKFTNLFDLYVSEKAKGVVLLVGEASVLMAGYHGPMPFEMNITHRAMCWGIKAVNNIHRDLLMAEATKRLKEMGFEGMVTEVLPGSKEESTFIAAVASETPNVRVGSILYMVDL